MPQAIDTVGFYRTSGTAVDSALAAATASSGDSFTVRNGSQTAAIGLMAIGYDAATSGGQVQVKSPLLHDDVRGITLIPGQTPSQLLLPMEQGQVLKPQDTLTVQMLVNHASETDVGFLSIYYADLPGAAARLHSWADISGIIANLKPLEVDFSTNGTGGVWQDTAVTTTENLLKANTDYAVLGYLSNTALCAIGVKGSETANLRVAGPGVLTQIDTTDYFVWRSNVSGIPQIPVFNAANAASFYLSCLAQQASTAVKVSLILAQLSRNLPT